MDTSEVWAKALNAIRQNQMVTRATYDTVFVNTTLASVNGVYTIKTPSETSKEWLEYRLRDIVARALRVVTDQVVDPKKLVFVLLQEANREPLADDDDTTPIHIRNKRKERRYYIDNEFVLLGYVARLGPFTTAVYNVLCCRADNDTQTSYPGKRSIADDAGMSLEECKRAIKLLEQYHLIHVLRQQEGKRWKSNTYTLLDVSEWILF